MSSPRVWGAALVSIGAVYVLSLVMVLVLAIRIEGRANFDGVSFIIVFMFPGVAMLWGGIYLLLKARRN